MSPPEGLRQLRLRRRARGLRPGATKASPHEALTRLAHALELVETTDYAFTRADVRFYMADGDTLVWETPDEAWAACGS